MRKKRAVMIMILILSGFSAGVATGHPRNNGLEGLLIGAGSGAIIGHAIARDTEGAIVGSFIGGTMGLMIGLDRDQRRVFARPHHVPDVTIVYQEGRSHHHDRWQGRHHRRGHHSRHRHERHRHGR